MLYAIDQFLMAGGGLIVMMDPFVRFNPGSNVVTPQPSAEIDDISDLVLAYGVRYRGGAVVGDAARAAAVADEREVRLSFPYWMRLTGESLSTAHPVTAALNEVFFRRARRVGHRGRRPRPGLGQHHRQKRDAPTHGFPQRHAARAGARLQGGRGAPGHRGGRPRTFPKRLPDAGRQSRGGGPSWRIGARRGAVRDRRRGTGFSIRSPCRRSTSAGNWSCVRSTITSPSS